MIIDVALSSCARAELLEKSIQSFFMNVETKHKLRWIIVEDKVDDKRRQEAGRKWILDNFYRFDKIIYSEKKLTYVYCFGEVLKYVTSDYFIRWEDDFEFQRLINIDPIIDTLMYHDKEKVDNNISPIANISFKRNYCDVTDFTQRLVSNSKEYVNEYTAPSCMFDLIESPLFSIGPGIFNTKLTREIVDLSGTGECHEFGVLTPSMDRLGYKSFIWGSKEEPFLLDHVGKKLGFKKGEYK